MKFRISKKDSWANANLTCSRGNMSLIDLKNGKEMSLTLIRDHVYLTPGEHWAGFLKDLKFVLFKMLCYLLFYRIERLCLLDI